MTAPKPKKTAAKIPASLDRNHMMGSVAATLDLLDLFVQNNTNSLHFNDFVKGTGRPKSSVHRMLATLLNKGFIVQDDLTRKYSLTLKLWRLGLPALEQHDLSVVARPYLKALMQTTEETVHLAVSTGDGNVVYVAKFESQRSIRVQTQLGGAVPSYCTATGRSILANDPQLWEAVKGMEINKRTENTVTDLEKLASILQQIRDKGYAVTLGEMHSEMGGVAAPIFDHSGNVVGSFGVAIPLFRMTEELIERSIGEVLMAARKITDAMSHIE